MSSDPGLPAISQLDRYRLWALIQALEDDVRRLWVDHVVRDRDEQVLMPDSLREKALANRQRGGDLALDYDEPLIAFVDLGEVIDLLAGSGEAFDDSVMAASMVTAAEHLKKVIPTRNRLAHHRPLGDQAVREVLDALSDAIRGGLALPEVEQIATQIRLDPDWLPADTIQANPWEQTHSRVLHNVPYPFHEDTGLVGRKREVQSLYRGLTSSRFPAYSILGPGGMGKTALALEVLWRLIEEDSPYEAILYASLKTESLTPDGVVDLAAPLTTVSEALGVIAGVLDTDLQGTFDVLGDSLEGIPTLIVIDNLETDIGADLASMMAAMPDSVRFLFTSRIGLPSGFGDKAVHLEQLSGEAAIALFRRYCRARNLAHLAALDDESVEGICDAVERSPLGIRWLLNTVEAGVPIETILEKRRSDLIAFCVGNVYSALPPEAKRVAAALAMANGPTTTRRLSLLTDQADLDAARLAVRHLKDASLVVAVADPNGYEAFSLSEMATTYVESLASAGADFDEMKRRLLEWEGAEERRRLDERNLLNPNTVMIRSPADRESALLLRKALRTLFNDRAKALEEIETARSLSRDYYEVDRVHAFVMGLGGEAQASVESYLMARESAPDDQGRARVEYHLANHLMRNHRSHEALELALSAHRTLGLDGTRFSVARAQLFCGDTGAAIEELERVAEGADGRLRVMALTSLIEAHRRRAQQLAEDARASEALDAVLAGLDAYDARDGVEDSQLHETAVKCAGEGIRSSLGLANPHAESDRIILILRSLRKNPAWRTTRDRPHIARHLDRLNESAEGELALEIDRVLYGRVAAKEADKSGRIIGEVERFEPDHGWGFAKGEDLTYHLRREDLADPRDGLLLHTGALIAFVPEPADRTGLPKDRYQECKDFTVEVSENQFAGAAANRSGIVVFADGAIALVKDDLSGLTAVVQRSVLDSALPDHRRPEGCEVRFSVGTDSAGMLIGYLTKRGEFRYEIEPDSLVLL